jgi:hypothetical protein
VRTTQIYLHVMQKKGVGAQSPLDVMADDDEDEEGGACGERVKGDG